MGLDQQICTKPDTPLVMDSNDLAKTGLAGLKTSLAAGVKVKNRCRPVNPRYIFAF